jgi:hypothetical protein
MGIEPKSDINYYRTQDKLHSNAFLPKVMSKNFFLYLSAALHIPNEEEENNDENIDPRNKINSLIKRLS